MDLSRVESRERLPGALEIRVDSPHVRSVEEVERFHDELAIERLGNWEVPLKAQVERSIARLGRPRPRCVAAARRVVSTLRFRPEEIVADVGAGSGDFARRMAPHVSRVDAVDTDERLLRILAAPAARLLGHALSLSLRGATQSARAARPGFGVSSASATLRLQNTRAEPIPDDLFQFLPSAYCENPQSGRVSMRLDRE